MSIPDKKSFLSRDNSRQIAQFRRVPAKLLVPEEAASSTIARATSSGLSPYSGEWGASQAVHLLRRTTFGAKKEDIKSFAQMDRTTAVATILQTDPSPPLPINDYYYPEEGLDDPDVAQGETWIEAPYNIEYEGARITSLKGWVIKNILHQPTTIHEKMILFWHNLLVTESWGVFISKSSYQYFMLLRNQALGNYKELIKAMTLDVSMLFYLNGTFNNKEAPDENYARELQELFCIGKGPNANFSESDVQAAARVLTGWVVDWESIEQVGVPRSFFYPDYHETSDKQFSGFYGNKLITGKAGNAGADELDELIDMIFDNSETALYICRRIYQFFVYSTIDDATEQNVIAPLAEIFRDNNYDILPVLEALFTSEHFFDEANVGALIKSPADFLLGTWRSVNISEVGEPGSFLRLEQYQSMLWTMAGQGMELGDPPNVSGWPAYYQSPQYDKYWITTDTITNRAITTDSLWHWGFWINANEVIVADLISFVSQLDQPDDPNEVLSEVVELAMGIAPSEAALVRLKAVLLDGQESDYYWTNAWNAYQIDSSDMEAKSIIENRLKFTFQSIFQHGECHLM